MTTPLHDLLDDLGRSEEVSSPALAERAWADGRRRRRRSRVQGVVAAAAALLLLALVAPVLLDDAAVPQFARSGSAGVDGHPERIGHQWWVRDLPDRPGPVAAVLEGQQSVVVRADGHRWRLPGRAGVQLPALSRDGRLLGYLATPDGPYVVHDLVSGSRTRFPELFAAGLPTPGRTQLAFGSSAWWSPDGRYLLLYAAGGVLVLDPVQGPMQVLEPPGAASVVGWADADRIVWVATTPPSGGPAPAELTGPEKLVTTDRTGRVLAEVDLEASPELIGDGWYAAVAPDGREVAVGFTDSGRVRTVGRFATSSGRQVHPPVSVQEDRLPCGTPMATRDGMLVPTFPFDGQRLVQEVTPTSTSPFTVAAPTVDMNCIHWAQDAVTAPGRGGGLLGTYDAAWTWWWKEALLALAVAAVLVRPLRALRQRRRARRADRELIPWRVDWYS